MAKVLSPARPLTAFECVGYAEAVRWWIDKCIAEGKDDDTIVGEVKVMAVLLHPRCPVDPAGLCSRKGVLQNP
jgi:hypothetical protein